MADFDRNTLGNRFPIVANESDNPQFTYRTTPKGSALKGSNAEFRVYATSRSEEIVNNASFTWNVGSSTATFTAVDAGSSGDDITLTFVQNSNDDGDEVVTVSGTDITVEFADTGGSIDSTVQQVVDAINNDNDASALVTGTVDSGGGDTATTLSQTNLDGGVNTAVDADLESIEIQLRTENRPSSSEQFLIKLPGPASSDIDPNDANKPNSVRDYISDFLAGTLGSGVSDQSSQNTAGAAFQSAGFNFKFSGSGNEGMWTVEIPGDTQDNQYTVNAPSDNSLNVLPGGIVLANVQIKSVDSFGNFYYYGDNTGTYDSTRGWKMYTPYSADLNDDGNSVDIFRVADARDAGNATSLDYGIAFAGLLSSEVVTAIDTVDTDIQTTVGPNDVGDSAVIAVSDALSGGSAGDVDAALANEPRIIADIPSVGVMNDRGVRLQAALIDGAPSDTGVEGEIRLDNGNNELYVYSGGAWVSVSLT